ncbi:hypothetical protein QBC32DRAFT_45143 [Pseudoneurospora amorphoporcata]|uniref:Vacuolar sorting protein Vps3844 C-terminal domain-containing protein n=1 Tax=Pseudoneurospora amorphoporcata TaxID=241081 RepID=A0AAN6NNB1_9PEZI|nr:hypothetical protein QBC32DRAFT_45143 [Pseudoneurospora amorphoporcata]
MRFLTSITVAALCGLAAAASQQSADVFILDTKQQQQTSREVPRLPKEVVRHILLQRTSRDSYGSDLRDIPSSVDTEAAISFIAKYGKSPAPLFSQTETSDPSQLVVILEGITAENAGPLKESLAKSSQHAAFAISDPPSKVANDRLMTLFQNLGIAVPEQCDLASAINPVNGDCWTGSSSVVKYDVKKSPEALYTLVDNLSRLNKFISSGDLEALLVLMPESSRSSKLNQWSVKAATGSSSDLRRRFNSETVIVDDSVRGANGAAAPTQPPVSRPTKSPLQTAAKKVIPQCFTSQKSCEDQTNTCSGHGKCVNKWGDKNGTSKVSGASCFVCKCLATTDGDKKSRKMKHWGGNMCQKEDISMQFWLIAGSTIALVGAIAFAIGLLFDVGEEKMPGVLGAGVVRGSSTK